MGYGLTLSICVSIYIDLHVYIHLYIYMYIYLLLTDAFIPPNPNELHSAARNSGWQSLTYVYI